MQIGVFTNVLRSMGIEQVLDYLTKIGVEAVELGVGAYPGSVHCPMDELLAKPRKARDFAAMIRGWGFTISSLSCHGNPLHPNTKIAREHHEVFRNALRLARLMDVDVVTTFSGCPGGAPGDQQPNWVTCAWPPEYQEIQDYQWNKVVIPYWRDAVKLATRQGVEKIAIEMHPGFVVYNPETLLRLREAAGPAIGVNLDPSHLFWQGIDPCTAARALKEVLWHVHMKDTSILSWNAELNGMLDAKPYQNVAQRSWNFRTIGYGHSREFWCNFISGLQLAGYEHVLSIEHEDRLMNAREGLERAIRFLQRIVITTPKR